MNMRIYGKVVNVIPRHRIIKLLCHDKIKYLYFQRKDFHDFGPYFFDKPYLFVEINEEKKKIDRYMVNQVVMFYRIVQPSIYTSTRPRSIYFDMETIKKGVKKLINKPHNKMFIDLEFTMPFEYQTFSHVAEIIQYGMIVEDKKGNVIFSDCSLVKPSRPYRLNKPTLNFLSLKRDDFNDACQYIDFYNKLKMCMKEYKPKVYVWGSNDIIEIDRSFRINKVKPIDVKKNHINLMHLIKNYYNIKDEIGLFYAYEKLSNSKMPKQKHDALEDAEITKEIFYLFKDKINKEV